jgi:hypothetical protein
MPKKSEIATIWVLESPAIKENHATLSYVLNEFRLQALAGTMRIALLLLFPFPLPVQFVSRK